MIVNFFFDVRATVARESGDFQLTKKEKRTLSAVPLTISFLSFMPFFCLYNLAQLGYALVSLSIYLGLF
jgi:hypothetical protein